jgi:hypothetical protein
MASFISIGLCTRFIRNPLIQAPGRSPRGPQSPFGYASTQTYRDD